MATFNAGTVQASIEIDQSALSGSVSQAVSQVRQMGSQGEAAGKDAGKKTGAGFAGAMGISIEGALDQLKDKVKDKLGDALKGGEGLAKVAGAGVGLALAAALVTAVSFEPVKAKLTAQLGLTTQESARIGGVAGKLYGAAYGEGLEDVNNALRSVIQNVDGMRNASTSDLQSITGQVMSLSSAFDQDLGATTRAVGQMMRTGLAANAQEALDIIARGFQTGADKSEDFLDTLNEYGTKFRDVGLSGVDATGLISQGLKAGARDADTVADAIKEFAIVGTAGAKTTTDALTAMGLNAQKVTADIAAGGPRARAAFDQVTDGLRAVEDPAQRAAFATATFGTKAEDLGQALFSLDLTTAADQLGTVAGASAEVDKVMGDTAQGGLTSIFRGFQLLGDTLGTMLLPILKPVITGILGLVNGLHDLPAAIMELPGPILLVGAALIGWALLGTLPTILLNLRVALLLASVAINGFIASISGIGAIIAIAGAAFTAMSFLIGSTKDSAEIVQEAKDRWDGLVQTLDSVSGAVTDATRAQLTQEAQQSGMLDTLDKLGVSTKDYIDASSGVAGAQDRLGASVQAAAEKVLKQSDAYHAVAESLAGAGVSQDQFIAAMESGDIGGIKQQVDDYAQAQGRLTGSTTTTTDIQNRFAQAVADGQGPLQQLGGILNLSGADADGFATEADKAAQRSKALGENAGGAADGVDKVGGAAVTTTQSVDPMADALKAAGDATSALDQATKFLALTLDQAAGNIISSTEAQNAYDASTQGIAQSQRDYQQAVADADQAAQDLSKAEQDGSTTAAQLAEAHRKVADASAKVSDAERAQFDANVKTQSTAIALATSIGQQEAATHGLKAGTDAATTSLTNAKNAFIAAQPEADRTSGKADRLADALFGIPANTVAHLSESGALGVQQQADAVTSHLHGIPANTQANVSTNAVSVIGALDTVAMQLRGLNGSNTVVTVTRRVVGDTQLVQADGGHIQKAAAGLRLLAGRGISQRRAGSGQGVTWAEGITGEEFYISLKPGQEQRNRAFLSQAAEKLGGRATFGTAPTTPAEPAMAAAAPTQASRVVTVGSVSIGRFDDADRFFDRMAWEQLG